MTQISRNRTRLLAAVVLAVAGWAVPAAAQPDVKGQWHPVMDWPNVAIHAQVLPDGKVLFWGRREWNPDGTPKETLDAADTTPRIWDPQANTFTEVDRPGYNLFCAGHTFLADGKLLVVGGHDGADGQGKPHARLFDHASRTWTPIPDMNRGRWYPTAVALPDGGALVSSGNDAQGQRNIRQQVWKAGSWQPMVEYNDIPLYPRMHVAHDGQVCMSGHLQRTVLLNLGTQQWTEVGFSAGAQREEGTAVMYAVGKVLIVGGGVSPQKSAEKLDLTAGKPAWQPAGDMSTARRHLNATLLPDGTVLVTGGTSGGGFNDVTKPVKHAEVWDPATDQWTSWAAEDRPRLYHSTAVLLPDGRVLSAGGGEYRLENLQPNPNADSQRNAQLFSPPYLFKSTAAKPRPDITGAPETVTYGETFEVGTSRPDQVARVSWVRLSSVTHSFNMGQRINFLTHAVEAGKLKVTAPANANQCPPGHYMLFVLNDDRVPSVAKIVRIR